MTQQTVEYGIRATMPGDSEPSEWLIGTDDLLQRQRVADLLDEGARDVALLRRPRADWTVDPDALTRILRERHRAQVLDIAEDVWEAHGDTVESLTGHGAKRASARLGELLADAVDRTAAFSTLDPAARLDKLLELLGEMTHQEHVAEHQVEPEPGQDRAGLAADAERRVNEAADALIGGVG